MVSNSKISGYSTTLLSGKLALVTGAGKGIGRTCAEALVKTGASVIAVARTEADLLELAGDLGDKLIPWVEDVTSDAFLSRLEARKDIDILINNVGSNQPEPFIEIERSTYDRIVDMNLGSVFRATQVVVRNLLQADKAGSIVNISSQMGHVGSPKRTLYCATKHAIEGFTKALAVELAQSNIRINSVAPTFVETALTKPMLENPEFANFVMSKIPMNKLASTDDVAAAVIYLASELSSMVTGTSVLVDGGWVAH
ncbi:SDR family NAD(P)-dependent oxidoreductase [Agarilytica rhodophyticola]|uniref:SDR family NAD(P)-dependent oxidoreductase n=1 Tax=Agarilytica rhodophyticola TaxID=1737490 RepID=UPI0015714308|nr:SDR family oxidoreductase [Agarilytica rhodophyticola]